MRRRSRIAVRLAVVVGLAATSGAGAQALTASNTVPSTRAGSGSSAIDGYAVSSVDFTLDGSNPLEVDAVKFTITPATGTVKAQLGAGGSWYACTNASGSVTCHTTSPQATVDDVDTLAVVAAQ